MSQVLARMAYSNLPLKFESLALSEQQQLVKILHTLALPRYQHQRLVFGVATIEQIQAVYPFYPAAVAWQTPLLLESADLQTLFDAFVQQLASKRVADTLMSISDSPRWPDAQVAAKAVQVTRTAFNALSPEAVGPPTGAAPQHGRLVSILKRPLTGQACAGAEYVVIDGQSYLGSSATMDQVLELRRDAGLRRHGTGFIKLLGTQVELHTLYNAVQQHGGWQEVRDRPNLDAELASASPSDEL